MTTELNHFGTIRAALESALAIQRSLCAPREIDIIKDGMRALAELESAPRPEPTIDRESYAWVLRLDGEDRMSIRDSIPDMSQLETWKERGIEWLPVYLGHPVEREPVAWRYEYLSSIQKWLTEYSNTKPPESACFRNIVPLYAAPPIEREPSDEDLGGMTGAELCGGDS